MKMKAKLKNKGLGLVLAFAVAVSMLPIAAFQVSAAESDWSYPAATPTLTWGGSGSETDPYTIDTAQELADLAYMVNEEENYYAGAYFKLTADIDLNPGFTATIDGFTGEGTPQQWIPIGEVCVDDDIFMPFCGVFDGDDHTVKGMYLADESCSSDAAGLFEYVDVYDEDTPSGVKNLKVENSYLYSVCENHTSVHCTALGTVLALNCSTVENCHVSDTYLTLDCPEFGWFMGVGGIVSDNNAESSQVVNCSFDGAVTYTGNYSPSMAGIVASNSGYVANCINYGNVQAETDRVGGIVGTNRASLEAGEGDYTCGVVENCINYGDVHGQYKVGGIVGHSGFYNDSQRPSYVKNCVNYGNVSADSDNRVGGVVGLNTYSTTINCFNYGKVSNQSDPATFEKTGGIIGVAYLDFTDLDSLMENCWYLKNDATNTQLNLVGNLDGSSGSIVNSGSLSKVKVEKPAADATVFTYNGEEQSYTVASSFVYTVTGNKRTEAGSQTVTVKLNDTDNYEWSDGSSDDLTFTFTVNKADQTAPAVQSTNETVSGKKDGAITAVDSTMEYRKDGEDTYTAVSGDTVAGLAAGDYYVRVKGDDNHNPSADTKVTVAAGSKLTVNFVAGGKTVDTVSVDYGADVDMTKVKPIPAKDGYTAKWDKDGKEITEDITITAVYTKIPVADTDSPDTGDNSNMRLWFDLLVISAGAVVTLIVVDRKRRTIK